MIEVAAPEAVRFDERPPVSGTTATPATCFASCWGVATLALVVFIELAEEQHRPARGRG